MPKTVRAIGSGKHLAVFDQGCSTTTSSPGQKNSMKTTELYLTQMVKLSVAICESARFLLFLFWSEAGLCWPFIQAGSLFGLGIRADTMLGRNGTSRSKLMTQKNECPPCEKMSEAKSNR